MNEYKNYDVQWEVKVRARSAAEAARIALAMQRHPEGDFTVFSVNEAFKTERLLIDAELSVDVETGEDLE